jgi:hypothetical protein
MKPIQVDSPDFTDLIRSAQEYVEYISSEDYHEDGLSDYENQIFESAMEAVFGPKIWDWINNKEDTNLEQRIRNIPDKQIKEFWGA